ncbi:hypothetical protein FRC10_007769 [Ceratobasidium sp. 414]|nr:hypothetical protein FRC10_007769 [Ceratobasidium sp. 414]
MPTDCQELVASAGWSMGKEKAYDDELDQLQQVKARWAKIQCLGEDVASLWALRGEVSMLQEQIGQLEQAERNVKEIHASVVVLVRLLQPGTDSVEGQLVAKRLALGGAFNAVAASVATLDLVPGPSKVGRLHKNKNQSHLVDDLG